MAVLALASQVAISAPPAARAATAAQDVPSGTLRERREAWRSIKPGITILRGEMAEMLLRQCSRSIPAPYDGHWRPTRADINMLEQQLFRDHPELLAQAGIEGEAFPDTIYRQYAGFTRNGRRYVYASYGRHAGTVCDGGPGFFGVEFSMPDGEVTHVAYNGFT